MKMEFGRKFEKGMGDKVEHKKCLLFGYIDLFIFIYLLPAFTAPIVHTTVKRRGPLL